MDAAAEARKHRHVASLRTRLVIEDTLVDNQRATALARYVVDLCAAMRDPTRGWYRDANQLEKVFEMESPEPTTKNVGRRVLEIITDWKLFNEALALHSILGISVTEHVAGMAEEERRFAALFGDSASLRFRVR